MLERLKLTAQFYRYNTEQRSLLEKAIDTDLAALAAEIEQVAPPSQIDSCEGLALML